jgi:hypothetical protein
MSTPGKRWQGPAVPIYARAGSESRASKRGAFQYREANDVARNEDCHSSPGIILDGGKW